MLQKPLAFDRQLAMSTKMGKRMSKRMSKRISKSSRNDQKPRDFAADPRLILRPANLHFI